MRSENTTGTSLFSGTIHRVYFTLDQSVNETLIYRNLARVRQSGKGPMFSVLGVSCLITMFRLFLWDSTLVR